MIFNSIKKRIALKISIYIVIFILVLQMFSGLLSSQAQTWLINKVLDDIRQNVQTGIDEQKTAQINDLANVIEFNTKTVAAAVSTMLYNFEELDTVIVPYMEIQEIVAINVLSDAGSYAAVWRDGTIKIGKQLPEGLSLKGLLLVEADSIHQGEQVGKVKTFYSTELLKKKFTLYKTETFKDFDEMKGNIEGLEAKILYYQILGQLILVSIFIILIFLIIRSTIRPLNNLADIMLEVENSGEFNQQAKVRTDDEVGAIANALNRLLNNLRTSISNVNDVMSSVAKGELSKRVVGDQKGDLKHLKNSINDSVELLSNTIMQVVSSSSHVYFASQELANSSQSLATGATNQAASLQEIASSMNEVGAQTKANNENANKAQELSNQALQVVQRGNVQMESMLQSIGKINETSSKVSKVIKVIDEIAFQTNLLALNAAVEAARAGKYGKGFAVVAEEVRNLASRSAEAAKSTTDLIEASMKEVENGVKNADLTAAVLNEIINSVEKNNDLVKEIAVASEDQNRGIGEINQGLNNINDIVQQNSSISEESASASEELSSQATELQSLMRRFNVGKGETKTRMINQPVYQPRKQIAAPEKPHQEPEISMEKIIAKKVGKRKTITLGDNEFGKY